MHKELITSLGLQVTLPKEYLVEKIRSIKLGETPVNVKILLINCKNKILPKANLCLRQGKICVAESGVVKFKVSQGKS